MTTPNHKHHYFGEPGVDRVLIQECLYVDLLTHNNPDQARRCGTLQLMLAAYEVGLLDPQEEDELMDILEGDTPEGDTPEGDTPEGE